MNADILKGQWKQMTGRVKQQWGRLSDDDIAEINGDRDVFLGKIQELYGRSKEEAAEELDRWAQAAGLYAASSR
jgi:uncharacterized protein YjbJ (UPF0337 family)